MITRIQIKPKGFPCKLRDCKPGLFLYERDVCFRSDYNEFYIIGSGETFWAGTASEEQRGDLTVQPMIYEITEN